MSACTVSLEVKVEEPELLRYLGYPPGRRPSRRLASRLPDLWAEAGALIACRGAYRLVDRGQLEMTKMPDPGEVTVVALVTIGADLEGAVSRRSSAGDHVAAMILDAYGSAAAEASAEIFAQQIRRAVAEEDLCAQRRISPGYGRWDVRRQGELLALLPAADLGVRLTSGMMMTPRKSVSFAMRLAPMEALHGLPDDADRCETCDVERCFHARKPSASITER